jgi:hypothetical protein
MKWNLKYLAFALAAIIILGLLHIPYPFCGDQAFFLLGAKEMHEGAVLYRDFWDIKQPGIFFFYLYAGNIFGFTAIGIHAFELCYWLGFSLILMWFIKRIRIFAHEELIYVAPLMVVGYYYGFASHRLLTQVEALVIFPLMLTTICNTLFLQSKNRKTLWLFLSGVAGGLVIFFKLIFAPILALMWLWLLISAYRKSGEKEKFKVIFNILICCAIGIITAWIPFLVYALKYQIVGLCFETFFKYPPLIVQFGEKKALADLIASSRSFFSTVSMIMPFTLFSFLLVPRMKFLNVSLGIWLIGGLAIIIMQVTSWYYYQFQLLYFPIIFLTLIALDFIFGKLRRIKNDLILKKEGFLRFFLLIILNFPLIYTIASSAKEMKSFHFATTQKSQIEFSTQLKDNLDAYQIAINIPPQRDDNCPIFVIDNPLVYYYTGRNQSISQSGWSMQLFVPGQMDTLLCELERTRPCLIFMYNNYVPFMHKHGENVLIWIKKNYAAKVLPEGIWFNRND